MIVFLSLCIGGFVFDSNIKLFKSYLRIKVNNMKSIANDVITYAIYDACIL